MKDAVTLTLDTLTYMWLYIGNYRTGALPCTHATSAIALVVYSGE